jgi:predicted MPP superfamily phosphohydrolase
MFITIFLSIFFAGNFYVFARGWQALPANTATRLIYTTLFLFTALSFIFGEISEKTGLFEDNKIIILIGSTWLAFLLYAILALLMIDIVRGLNFFFQFLPSNEVLKAGNVPLKLMIGVVTAVSMIVIAGIITASSPVIKTVDIKIPKKGGIENSLNIVMASDIHLGNIIGKKKFQYLVDTINSLDSDIVLFPGDFFDETLGPVIKDNMGPLVESIKAKYGVYAVTGNHEYIGGVDEAVNFMTKHKIRVLRDEAIEVNGSFIIAGREDKSINRFTGGKRKSLEEILIGKNIKLPVILMDHQPSTIDESVRYGIDLHLSGHTHNGQLWPVNYITKAIFEVSCGYKKIKDTNVYVSKGYGTWGPPVRTSGRPEIVVFQIRFTE